MGHFNNDQVSGGIWLVIGLTITIASIRYGLGTLDSPETGFMPFWAGLTITFFSFIGLILATIKQRKGVAWKSILIGVHWGKSLFVLGTLVAYIVLLPILGFLICTILFLGFLFRGVKPMGWGTVIGGSILLALGAYGIFEVWLQAQLPKGPWGF
jgi:hypothetical protein